MDSKTINLNEKERGLVKRRIKTAISFRDTLWTNDTEKDVSELGSKPDRWKALVRGDYWDKVRTSRPGLPRYRSVNQILPKLRIKMDTLTGEDTVFNIKARKPEYDDEAENATNLLTDNWDVLKFDREVNKALWDANTYGFGVVELGWIYQDMGESPLPGERPEVEVDAEPDPMLDMMASQPNPMMAAMGPLMGGGQPGMPMGVEQQGMPWTPPPYQETEEPYKPEPVKDDPFIERFSPEDFIWDPFCTDPLTMKGARYAFRVRSEWLSKLKANKRYKNTKDLKGKGNISFDDGETRWIKAEGGDEEDSPVTLYDGYMFIDLDHDGTEEFIHLVMTDEHDLPLIARECPYLDDDGNPLFGSDNPFPFRVLPDIIVDNDSFLPESSVEQAASLQIMYDEAGHQFHQRRKKSNRQFLAPTGAFSDPEARAAIESGKDGALIEIASGDTEQVKPMPHADIQPEVYQSLELVPELIGQQMAVNRFQEGMLPEKRRLATEVNQLVEQSGARASGESKRFREFKEELGFCVLVLLQQFATRERKFPYETEEGGQEWGSMGMAELRGFAPDGGLQRPGIQWKVEIEADDKVRSEEQKRDEAQELLSTVAQFASMPHPTRPGLPMVMLMPVLRHVLKQLDVPHIDKIVLPDPTPQELMMVQAQAMAQYQMMQEQQAAQAAQEQQMMIEEQARQSLQGGQTNG